MASKGKFIRINANYNKNALLVGPEDFMRDFTEEYFFIWSEISGRLLPHEGLFVKKRHLSFSLSPALRLSKSTNTKDKHKVRKCPINTGPFKVSGVFVSDSSKAVEF